MIFPFFQEVNVVKILSPLFFLFFPALTIGAEPRSTSNLQVSRKGLPDTFLTRNELEKINAQRLKNGKAEN